MEPAHISLQSPSAYLFSWNYTNNNDFSLPDSISHLLPMTQLF